MFILNISIDFTLEKRVFHVKRNESFTLILQLNY